MSFRATWVPSTVNNRDGFSLFVDNFSVSAYSLPGIVRTFTFEYMRSANGGFVFYCGYAYFTRERARHNFTPPAPDRFHTLDEFYELVQERALPGAYNSRITIRELNQQTFTNCGEVGLTPEILQTLFDEIEIRLNNEVVDVCEAVPLLK